MFRKIMVSELPKLEANLPNLKGTHSCQAEASEEVEAKWSGWSLQSGYQNAPDPNNPLSMREMPVRTLSPGLNMGLSVVLDVQHEDYYCSGTESVGFKVQNKASKARRESIIYEH